MDCYVLVGGRSRRMGVSKSEIVLGGVSFLERVAAAAREAFDRVFFVGVSRPAGVDEDDFFVDERGDDRAAIFGLAKALTLAREKFWLLGVDYPLVTVELLRALRERFVDVDAEILVPEWHAHPQMLCAGYSVRLREVVERQIAAGELSMSRLLELAPSVLLAEADLRRDFGGEPLWNVNTPTDLEGVKALYVSESR